MKLFTTSLYGAAALALALAAGPAHATAITGTNLDFELPTPIPLAPNSDTGEGANTGTVAIPGWTITQSSPGFGEAGVWAPKAGGVFFTSPGLWQGSQVGFLDKGLNISQNVNGAFTGNAGTVQVTLLLGEALGFPITPADDSITLLANGSAVATTTLATGGNPLIAGNFALENYDFSFGANALAGETLGLEISNNTDPSRVFVDDLVIDGTSAVSPTGGGGGGGGGGAGGGGSVPEPASLSILGAALLGFAGWRRVSGGGRVISAA